jgi:hypothetical protein
MVILRSPAPRGRERCCHYVGFGGILGISEALDYHLRIRGAHRPRNGVATAATFDTTQQVATGGNAGGGPSMHGRHHHWLMNPSQM